MIPLYGFLEGDTLGILVLAQPGESVRDVARRLQSAASVRVEERAELRVFHRGKALELDREIVSAGLSALERFDVRS